MNKTHIIVLAFIALSALTLFNLKSTVQPQNNSLFQIWKQKMNKNYEKTQNQYRFQVWLKNLQLVTQHNNRFYAGLQTYEVQMNLFADLTTQEFKAKYLGLQINPEIKATKSCTGKQAPTDNLPTQVNWETKGAVTPVKNQGQCGSCWAFSTTGSLEGSHFKAKSQLLSFSQQQLVDCSASYGNHGCNGGLMNNSFFYVKDNGITLEQKYPYRGVTGSCKYTSQDKVWTISDCTEVTVDKQLALRAAVAQQPVSVAIEANHISFQLYKGGVYSGLCGTNLDHGVLAVGYGTQDNKLYWRVKNSWGSSWGVKGYILIERDQKDGKGKCGIQMAASYPIA